MAAGVGDQDGVVGAAGVYGGGCEGAGGGDGDGEGGEGEVGGGE